MFHLRCHHFMVQMDNYSFTRGLELKNKTIPELHLLRLKGWFSKFDFSIQHIKRHLNLILYMLSKPKPVQVIIPVSTFPLIFRETPISPPLCFPASIQKNFFLSLENVSRLPQNQSFAKTHRFYFMTLSTSGMLQDLKPFLILKLLFLISYHIYLTWVFDKDNLWILWCSTVIYSTVVVFNYGFLSLSPWWD